jgi:hypothetical protein
LVLSATAFPFTLRIDFLIALITSVIPRTRAVRIITFVDLCIGITKLDSDVSLKFVLEPDCLNPRYSFHNSALPVSHMTDGTNVYRSLARDNFR